MNTTGEMSDEQTARLFAEMYYPKPDTANADELRAAYVVGWTERAKRTVEGSPS